MLVRECLRTAPVTVPTACTLEEAAGCWAATGWVAARRRRRPAAGHRHRPRHRRARGGEGKPPTADVGSVDDRSTPRRSRARPTCSRRSTCSSRRPHGACRCLRTTSSPASSPSTTQLIALVGEFGAVMSPVGTTRWCTRLARAASPRPSSATPGHRGAAPHCCPGRVLTAPPAVGHDQSPRVPRSSALAGGRGRRAEWRRAAWRRRPSARATRGLVTSLT